MKGKMDDIRAILRETAESQRQGREIQREIQASQRQGEENHRKIEEAQRKTEETMRKLGADLDQAKGDFTRKWGRFLENLIEGDLVSLLRNWGFHQDIDEKIQPIPNVVASNDDGTDKYELDLIVKNGELAFIVEVKTTLRVFDIDAFVSKLELVKDDFPAYKGKKVYGCMAYINAEKKEDALVHAQKEGLITIRAPGGPANIATITNPKTLKLRAF